MLLKNKNISAVVIFCMAMLLPLQGHAVDIIFATPPTQTVAKTQELYGPLAEYLSKASGANVILTPARNFLEYTNNMRNEKYDLIFDGPHFVGWRMDKIGHRPIARLPGQLIFAIVIREGSNINKPDDLIGQKVCGLASPNLATLKILDYYPNPVRQPQIVPVRSFLDALKCLQADEAIGAIMPVNFFNKFSKDGKAEGLKLLLTTKDQPLPHRTFSISNKVDRTIQDRITAALISADGAEGTGPVLKRYRSATYVAAEPELYRDLGRLLSSVWGFE